MCVCVCVYSCFPSAVRLGRSHPLQISLHETRQACMSWRDQWHTWSYIGSQSQWLRSAQSRVGLQDNNICTFIIAIDHASCNPLTWVTDSQCGCGLSFRNTLIVTIQAHADSVMSTTTTTQGNWMQLVQAACKLEPRSAHTIPFADKNQRDVTTAKMCEILQFIELTRRSNSSNTHSRLRLTNMYDMKELTRGGLYSFRALV